MNPSTSSSYPGANIAKAMKSPLSSDLASLLAMARGVNEKAASVLSSTTFVENDNPPSGAVPPPNHILSSVEGIRRELEEAGDRLTRIMEALG